MFLKKIADFPIIIFLSLLLFFLSSNPRNDKHFQTQKYTLKVNKLSSPLNQPWGFDFLSPTQIIITEKNGKVLILNLKNKEKKTIANLTQVKEIGQGGLLDVIVYPSLNSSKIYVYFTLSSQKKRYKSEYGTSLVQAELKNEKIKNFKILFHGKPFSYSAIHFGSRIQIDKNNYLYLSLGDRGNRQQAQKLTSHYGKIIRLNLNGTVPSDNPFIRNKNSLPEIYSYGHRNPQGMAIHPLTGEIWISEHGAKGGDEINLIQAGKNYGWPIISYGRHYSGAKIGIGTHATGKEQPIHYWDPSIAPSGMTFYTGKLFSQWQNNLFVSSLKFGLISRLEIKNNQVKGEERLFKNDFGRIRDIKQSPRGTLMFITDGGGLYEIVPI